MKTIDQWIADLAKAIDLTVKELRRDGVTGMGRDNLKAVVRPPRDGEPGGTNAAYFYGQPGGWFDQALALSKTGKRFVITR